MKKVANQPKRVRERKRGERTYRKPFLPSSHVVIHLVQGTPPTHAQEAKFHEESCLSGSTTSLSLSSDWLFSFHSDLLSSVGRYSLTSRSHNRFIICCRFLHVLKMAGIWLSNFPGGRELNIRLIRKWLGVRGVSLSGRAVLFGIA